MNNLRKFNWITQYNSAKEGEELVKPSVSLVIDKAVVMYDDDIHPIYRWINLDPSEDYICDMEQHIKYYKQKKQVSLDNGVTWNDVVPAEYRRGDIYEEKSTDCGYIPTKLTATFSDGFTYTKMYDGNPELTSDNTQFTGESKYEMTEAIIGDCVTSIGSDAFFTCSGLTSIDIPNSVTSIGNNALYRCSGLTSCTIGSGVTSIGNQAFFDCTGLTSIIIPNSVTSIGTQVFRYCSGLTSITSNAMTAPTISNYTFSDVNTGGTLYVPQGSSGYDTWMQNANYYLGKYNWTKVEQ